MASSSANQALTKLPRRPCEGSGKPISLDANYSTLRLPKLIVQRYAITIVQLNKGEAAPQKSDTPSPAKPSPPIGQRTPGAEQTGTSKPKAAVAVPATPRANPWKKENGAFAIRASSKATASTPGTAAGSGDPYAPTPGTDNQQKKDGPTGKKAEQIIKLFLDSPALAKFKAGIFSDFRALLFSTVDLPPNALSQVVKYRPEYNDTATWNAVEYLVLLDHTTQFDIARLTTRPGTGHPQLDAALKQDMIQALNILFLHYGRSSPSRLSVGSRRCFPSAFSTDSSMSIGQGIRAMRGYFSSVRVVDYRILVNVNVSHGSFYETGSLVDLMGRIDRNFKNHPDSLLSVLRGVRIGQKHFTDSSGKPIPFQKRTKMIVGFATGRDGRFPESPNADHPPEVPRSYAGPEEVKFWYKDSQGEYYISVAEYFKTCYPRWARLDRDIPVINVGSVQRPTYLPAEVCEVMFGQPYKKRLNTSQTSEMIKFSVRDSHVTRKWIVERGFGAVGLMAKVNPQMALLNIQADTKMILVEGRILTAPRLLYKNQEISDQNQIVHSRAGQWDLRDVHFRMAKPLPKWSYLNIEDENSRRNDLVSVTKAFEGFQKALAETGIKLGGPIWPESMRRRDASETVLRQWIYDCRHTYSLDVIFIVLPDKDAHRYNLIKRIGDVEVGIHTICVVQGSFCKKDRERNNKAEDKRDDKKKVDYHNAQTFANIALKANLKLQGLNHELEEGILGVIGADKTMVVGIDVTHPSPGSETGCPSVAAMVASIDGKLGQWPAALSLQYCPKESSDPRQPWEKKLDPRQEMVSEIGLMLGSRLDLWCKKHSSVPPANILIYRDGVSEGQYEAVLRMELKRMEEFCATYYRQKNQDQPQFTLVVVAKRHHTRFFVHGRETKSNPVNGTVVDRGVTDNETWDFFLQSHTPLQGTARPAHYIVLHNKVFNTTADGPPDCRNIADVVERITHNMCYMYSRATKSVSYCPAAYYADRACERGRGYLSRFFNRDPTSEEGPQSLATDNDIKVKEPLTDTMFYI